MKFFILIYGDSRSEDAIMSSANGCIIIHAERGRVLNNRLSNSGYKDYVQALSKAVSKLNFQLNFSDEYVGRQDMLNVPGKLFLYCYNTTVP